MLEKYFIIYLFIYFWASIIGKLLADIVWIIDSPNIYQKLMF